MFYRVFAAVVIGVAVCTLSLDAQGGKKATGTIEITKTKDGEFRYRVKNLEGKTIAMPLPQMSWEKKADVLKALNELKTILETATPVDAPEADTKDKAADKKKDKADKKPKT
jgi:uncharacterized protein YegP (UPF0339 family)